MNKTEYIIQVRSRIHKVFYRKIEIIEDYEFVILSLIDRAGGSIKFDELGVLLGFATKDIVDRNIRVDNAEAYILDQFLNSLINYKLIEKDNGLVNNLFWGEIALEKKEKYKFFTAKISLPEFFDLGINEKEFFNFENLGFDLKFKYETEITDNEFVELGVDFQEEYDNNLKNEFWNSSKLDKKMFSIDYIEDKPISFERNDITTEAYINVINNELSVFYEDINQVKLIDVLYYEQNKNSLSDITLKCIFANFLGSTETINSNNITPFLKIVNWEQIIIDNRVVWEVKFVDLILPNSNQLLSNQTSEYCELAFLESNLEKYTNFWDWNIVTKRVDIYFILENLSIYPWDISYLIKELEVSEIEKNLNEIIKIIGNSQDDIAILIPRITNEFLFKNIKSISLDLNLFLFDKRDDFDQVVYSYLEYKWDWYYVISNDVYEKIRLERTDFVKSKEDVSVEMPDEVSASHILISYKGADRADAQISRSKDEAKSEAERIRGLILNRNQDFAEMAKQHSDGPSKTKGGDLGKFKFEVMAKAFSEAAFSLDVGSVSDVVETGFGFHIIKRTE